MSSIFANMDRPLVVGIAGGTGSGKTTLARRLAEALPTERCALLEHDFYYKDRSELSLEERAGLNYDHPDALDSVLLAEHLRLLRGRQAADVPIYDYVTHTRKAETRRVEPAPVIILEGILVFVEASVREQMDVKLFVDTPDDLRVLRRVRRDIEHRGRDFSSIRDQYYRTVRPMHLQFVEPTKRWADLIIPEGGSNKVAIDVIVTMLERVANRTVD